LAAPLALLLASATCFSTASPCFFDPYSRNSFCWHDSYLIFLFGFVSIRLPEMGFLLFYF